VHPEERHRHVTGVRDQVADAGDPQPHVPRGDGEQHPAATTLGRGGHAHGVGVLGDGHGLDDLGDGDVGGGYVLARA
jgi:hypothetical protein